MAANTPAVHNVSQVVSHLKRYGGQTTVVINTPSPAGTVEPWSERGVFLDDER